jgi:hypothetical protein
MFRATDGISFSKIAVRSSGAKLWSVAPFS